MSSYFDKDLIKSILSVTEKIEGKEEALKRAKTIEELEKKIERIEDKAKEEFEEEDFEEEDEPCSYEDSDCDHDCGCYHENKYTPRPFKMYKDWEEFMNDSEAFKYASSHMTKEQLEQLEKQVRAETEEQKRELKQEIKEEENMVALKKDRAYKFMEELDLVDRVFGELKVTARLGFDEWEAQCSCGRFIIVSTSLLLSKENILMCPECLEIKREEFLESQLRIEERNIDLFDIPPYYHPVFCTTTELDLGGKLAKRMDEFYNIESRLEELIPLEVGEVVPVSNVYVMINKEKREQKPTYYDMRKCLEELKKVALEEETRYLAFPKIGCGADKLDWGIVRELIKEIFADTNMVLLFCYESEQDLENWREE